jgi:Prophage antirepressor
MRILNKNGEPWFVLKDVCDVLDLAHRVVRQRLNDDVCSTYAIPDNLGRPQETTIINEDGLYDVILESRKPEAKAFRKWITSEVIPSIRKHGAYMTPETIEKTLSDPDFIIGLATKLKEANEEKQRLQAKIEADKPKVLFAESLQVSDDTINVNDLAKLLKQNGIDIGEVRLFKWLRDNGYLIKSGSEYNMPTQKSMNLGLFEVKIGTRQSSDGTPRMTRTPKVTGKGQMYFINKFRQMYKGA